MPRKEIQMSTARVHAGQAALSICEALLLAMNDRGLLPEQEILGVLSDAAASHQNAVGTEAEMADHEAVAELINAIIAGGNSVRR
jgi:Mrp family chromosome partitioning ATPase